MRKLRSILFLAALALPSSALATPILYTLTATGSGNLGATTFTNAALTFTQIADTDNVLHSPVLNSADAFYTTGSTVAVNIAGAGDFTLASAMFLTESGAMNSVLSGVFGIYDNFSGGFYGIDGTALVTYFLATTLPPTSGTTAVLDYNRSLVSTSGDLHFSSFSNGVGSAVAVTVTPEPSGLALLGTGMIGAIALARRRFGASRT